MGGRGEVAGSQPMSTAVHRSPNKLWRSNSIFNLMPMSLEHLTPPSILLGLQTVHVFPGSKVTVTMSLSLVSSSKYLCNLPSIAILSLFIEQII